VEGLSAGDSLADPHVGWLDIKAADLEAQVRFYREITMIPQIRLC